MNDKKLIIRKKGGLRGEDGYKTFSVRIKNSTVNSLDEIAIKSERSRNEIINIFLEFAAKNCEIES